MKKTALIIALLMIFVISAASAQDYSDELTILNVAHLFSWSDTAADVNETLALFPEVTVGEFEISNNRKKLTAEVDDEAGHDQYSFYFDADSDLLQEIDILGIIYEDQSMADILPVISTYYGLDKAGPYENSELEEIGKNWDMYQIAAGPKTVCMLTADEPTDEKYGLLGILLVSREYVESE